MIFTLAVLLVGCGQSQEQKQLEALKQQNQLLLQQEQYQPAPIQQYTQQPQQVAPAPIIVQSAPAPAVGGGSNMVQDMMIGGLIGHAMAGGGSNNRNYSQPNVTRNVTINKTYAAPRSSYSAPRSTSSFSSARRR